MEGNILCKLEAEKKKISMQTFKKRVEKITESKHVVEYYRCEKMGGGG